MVEGSHLPFSLSHFPNSIGAECTQGRGKAGSCTSSLKRNDCGWNQETWIMNSKENWAGPLILKLLGHLIIPPCHVFTFWPVLILPLTSLLLIIIWMLLAKEFLALPISVQGSTQRPEAWQASHSWLRLKDLLDAVLLEQGCYLCPAGSSVLDQMMCFTEPSLHFPNPSHTSRLPASLPQPP